MLRGYGKGWLVGLSDGLEVFLIFGLGIGVLGGVFMGDYRRE